MIFGRRKPDQPRPVNASAPASIAIGGDARGPVNATVHLHQPRQVTWPHQVGVVPPLAHCRQERAADQALDAAVAGGGVVLCQVTAGLGGVGKTQLAAALTHRLWNRRELDLLVWVSATSRSAVVTAFAQASLDVTGVEDTDADQASGRFLAWLATTTRRWLVVFDDVTDPNDLQRLWPPATGTGRTVVTTRSTDNALTAGRQRINVSVFTSAESLAYLTAKLGGDRDRLDQASDLAEDLGHLPLALSQAAAYILDRANMTCASYRRRLADRRRQLAALAPRVLPDDYPYPVAVTWSLSIDRADTFLPAGLARPVLELAALLDPNGMPLTVFTTPTVLLYLGTRTGRHVEDDDVTDALDNLARLSLVIIDPASGTVAVHGLLQRVVREATFTDHALWLALTAADALNHIWPQIERGQEHAQALRANTAVLRSHAEPLLWDRTLGNHQVLFTAGNSLGATGQVTAAIDHFHTLHTTAIEHVGPDHPLILSLRDRLAHWRGEAGDYAGAADAYEELLVDAVRILGPDHPQTLSIRGNLAIWRREAGDGAHTAAVLEELLADSLATVGLDDQARLAIRSNLAAAQGDAGDPAGAATAFKELLEDMQRILGPEHPHTLGTRNNLAHWRGEAGDVIGAATALKDALGDMQRILGPEHPLTLQTRNNLALRRGEAGDVIGAATALKDALGDIERILGPEHPVTLQTRSNLAHWRDEAGDILATRSKIARRRGEAGDPAGAAAAYEELLADAVRILGPDHRNTLGTRNNLAVWRGLAGDPAGAAAACEELLVDCLRILGSDHPITAATRITLAHWRGESRRRSR
ncbi:tetratricopeptide repeat protein [Micromonospora antibiotica]|uniref:Tetratricopeptide repeat protein n=1 Tax=Micromonospora antibiotica TaxID=2807623 RepID=A0ABS3VFK1_9ACTN|nr:tetratricopeptide repeat protein [Micromonospora antibiotica]MBO4164420.1 tetratricopeptide repeat protein [Micromonospora antibiotica]